MNYLEKIKFQIYDTIESESFAQSVDILLSQLSDKESVLRLTFFGKVVSQVEYVANKRIILEKVAWKFAEKIPAISFVSQPTLHTPLCLEVCSLLPSEENTISYRSLEGLAYVLVENNFVRMLFAGGFQGDLSNMSIQKQSAVVFEQIDALLKKEQFEINQIIRQWNYLEQITKKEFENQHYQLFNNERSAFYAKTTWDNGYPAATGIGVDLGGILIDLDAISFKSEEAFATPIDNKLQIAAHAYSENVLLDANDNKSTPKFERAKSLTITDKQLVYISGTAAIRGENSLKGVGLAEQLRITMENIVELINDCTIKLLRVYLKNVSDYEETKKLMDVYKLAIPISYLHADVCRDELLIEIEGIAMD